MKPRKIWYFGTTITPEVILDFIYDGYTSLLCPISVLLQQRRLLLVLECFYFLLCHVDNKTAV